MPLLLDCNSCVAVRWERREAGGLELTEAVYSTDTSIPPHYHAGATVCLVLEGGYEERFSRTSFRCEPGSIVFSPPGGVHGDVFGPAGGRCFGIVIPERTFAEWVDGERSRESLAARQAGPSRWAFELRRWFRDGGRAADDAEELVFALLDELHQRGTVRATGRPPGWLLGIRDRVHEEFRNLPPLAHLAADAAVHRVHAAREFKRHFGCTIGEYARRRRVEHACSRLRQGPGALSAIAFEAGFADQAHMTRTLRRALGTTPGRFRARYGDRPRPVSRE